MRKHSTTSQLATLLGQDTPLPTNDKRMTLVYLTTADNDLHQMRPLTANLTTLTPQLSIDAGAHAAAKSPLTSIHNPRLPLPEARTFQKESECPFDIRTWVPFLPAATIRLGTREPHVLKIAAFYHAAPYLLGVSLALFLRKDTHRQCLDGPGPPAGAAGKQRE